MTWNPVTGCSKVSRGCQNCYASRQAKRLLAMHNPRYLNGFRVTLHPDLIDRPKTLRRPRKIFVNSMSDLFHDDVPLEFIQDVFRTMVACSQHEFQVLTKRGERLKRIAPELPWPENVWMGVSVEDADVVSRIDDLRSVPAAVRFLSCEPLIGPLSNPNLDGIGWVIVGGESGPGARPMAAEWVRDIRDQCDRHGIPFFFKQWGGVLKSRTGREFDGRLHDEFPVSRAWSEVEDATATSILPRFEADLTFPPTHLSP